MDLIVRNLTHVYGQGSPFEHLALDEVNLSLRSGSFIAILGPTGSGKSTLIQHFNGLLLPTVGEVEVGDIIITAKRKKSLHSLRKKVGLVFQYPEYQLFEESVEKDIAFGPLNYDLPPDWVQNRVREVMKLVGLDYEQYREQSPFKLSGGQKRRVALAGVLAMQPELLILDEPTAGLDPHGRREILQQLNQLHRDGTRTTILVTHNMEDAAAYADHIIVMNKGRVFLQGNPTEVFSEGEKLQQIGLDLPDRSKFVLKLNEQLACPLPSSLFSMDQLVETLMQRYREKQK